MKNSIWRFSLGGLLVFMSLVAVVVAFAANHSGLALLIVFGAAWALFESGTIFHLIQALSKPAVYLRHPFLVTGASLLIGLPGLVLSGYGLFTLWGNPNRNWMGLIPIALFGVLSVFCLTPLWLLVKYSRKAKDTQRTND